MIDVIERLKRLPAPARAAVVRALSADEAWLVDGCFSGWAHAGQRAPEGDWRTWLLMAGRGFGKTRAGAAWVHAAADADPGARIALVGATIADARSVMIEGPSGLLATAAHPARAPRFRAGRGQLVWPNGATATLFSGAHPDRLRGPEHSHAWCDELAKWRHPEASWDMLQFGLRAGARPRAMVTTTPRAGVTGLARLLALPDTVVTGGGSAANPHVPAAWLAAMMADYAGTRRGREELDGVLLADLEGALWPAALIERSRASMPARGSLVRVVIGVDPPASAGGTCGIVACGVDAGGVAHVLADHSASGLSPEGWARAVAAAADAWDADRVVAETNQGGEMVAAVLRAADAALPVTGATARLGKAARADPVAALFECGRARFAGRFGALEAELAGLTNGAGYQGPGRSPDRADAMVWALSALMLAGRREPGVHRLG